MPVLTCNINELPVWTKQPDDTIYECAKSLGHWYVVAAHLSADHLEEQAAEVPEGRVLPVVAHVAPHAEYGAELGCLRRVAGSAVNPSTAHIQRLGTTGCGGNQSGAKPWNGTYTI